MESDGIRWNRRESEGEDAGRNGTAPFADGADASIWWAAMFRTESAGKEVEAEAEWNGSGRNGGRNLHFFFRQQFSNLFASRLGSRSARKAVVASLFMIFDDFL